MDRDREGRVMRARDGRVLAAVTPILRSIAMVMPDFAYLRPHSLAEACALASRFGADAAFIAGGTELIPDFSPGARDGTPPDRPRRHR